MSWFQQNRFLGGFLAVLAIALAGVGFYCYSSFAKFTAARETFTAEKSKLSALERRELYPNQENVNRIRDSVENYQGAVIDLQKGLLQFQRPLRDDLSNSDFQQLLKQKVTEFQGFAEVNKVTLPENFYLGMAEYRANLPRTPAVPLLEYQLSAIDHLLRLLVSKTGVDRVISLNREPLPIESDAFEAPEPPPVLEKYPMELTFSSSHAGVQAFFNRISNDKEFFYIIRFMRIENSSKAGPDRERPSSSLIADDVTNDVTNDPESSEANYDAKLILGQEKIQVYVVIDLVRFEEESLKAEAVETAESTGSKE